MTDHVSKDLRPGTLVLCSYRLPSVVQPWSHDFCVGEIEEPGDDPLDWNGTNSERHYCEVTGRLRVRYTFGEQHDRAESLFAITSEQANLPLREKIALFLGDEALRTYDRASGLADTHEQTTRKENSQ